MKQGNNMNIDTLIRALSIGTSVFLLYLKISTIDIKHKIISLLLFNGLFYLSNFGLSFLIDEPIKITTIILLMSLLLSRIKNERISDTFIYLMISFAVSYALYMICVFVSTFLLIIVLDFPSFDLWLIILPSLMNLMILPMILQIKANMPNPRKNGISGFCIFLAGLIFILYSLTKNESISGYGTSVALFGIGLCIFGTVIWLRREKTIVFNKAVYSSAQNTIEQKNNEYRQLLRTHDSLATQVHKNNKTVLSLYNAVNLLAMESSDRRVKAKALRLLSEIKDIRLEVLSVNNSCASTGIAIIDAMILYMSTVAIQKGISLKTKTDENIQGILLHISIGQFENLIADLIENAITALEKSDIRNKKIRLNIELSNGIYQLSISDNGIFFAEETLKMLGKEKTTTNENGKGIGYMTIFEILQRTKASIIIDQQIDEKTIHIRFDGQKKFYVK